MKVGRRDHCLGGWLYELYTPRVSFTWASSYDHVEDQQWGTYAILSLGSDRGGLAFGIKAGADYARLYLGVGALTVGVPEPGEFEQLYPEPA